MYKKQNRDKQKDIRVVSLEDLVSRDHLLRKIDRAINFGTVKYYAQIHLQVWQNSVCTGQGNLPLIT